MAKKNYNLIFLKVKKNGLLMEWYENGQVKRVERYRSGVLEGSQTLWHKNGVRKWDTTFRFGKEIGLREFWGPDGKLLGRKQFFENK